MNSFYNNLARNKRKIIFDLFVYLPGSTCKVSVTRRTLKKFLRFSLRDSGDLCFRLRRKS